MLYGNGNCNFNQCRVVDHHTHRRKLPQQVYSTRQQHCRFFFNPSSMFWWTLYLNSYRITSDVRRRKHAWQIEFYVKRTNTSGNLHLKHKRESCNKNQMIYTINRTNTHNKLIQFTIRKQCTHTNENKCRAEFHSALAPWRKYRSRKQIVNDLHFTPPYTISNLQRSTPHLHRMLKT